MSDFRFRTEDIQKDELLKLFVETAGDRKIIDHIKAVTPTLIEGSRGTGKSFLLKVAEAELNANFKTDRILPVYVTFIKSSLVQTDNPEDFNKWMIAKLCAQVLRSFRKKGLGSISESASSLVTSKTGGKLEDRLETLVKKLENSWKGDSAKVEKADIPPLDEFKDALLDLCEENDVKRVAIFFDEVAHVFRPEQQRMFFSLFRDLRAPHISCSAAVYPGVTSYGSTFQLAHDATLLSVNRDVLSKDYVESMEDIVSNQADSNLLSAIAKNKKNFSVLSYAVSGNPRLLLKTASKCPKMSSSEVEGVIKEFYRTEIWSEHTQLADMYQGHKSLVDWGRDFIEKIVLVDTKKKNDQRIQEGKNESTCYFWVHRDAPEPVKAGLRLLSYTGVVQEHDRGIRGTRSELGDRFSINLGCLFALEAKPIAAGFEIAKNISIKRFSEYGVNHTAFDVIKTDVAPLLSDVESRKIFQEQLTRSIGFLDITPWQLIKLREIGLTTIGELLASDEETLIGKINYVGAVRAKQIMNAANSAMLEFLSG